MKKYNKSFFTLILTISCILGSISPISEAIGNAQVECASDTDSEIINNIYEEIDVNDLFYIDNVKYMFDEFKEDPYPTTLQVGNSIDFEILPKEDEYNWIKEQIPDFSFKCDWKSKKPKIATVNSEGHVCANSIGKTTIVVKIKYGPSPNHVGTIEQDIEVKPKTVSYSKLKKYIKSKKKKYYYEEEKKGKQCSLYDVRFGPKKMGLSKKNNYYFNFRLEPRLTIKKSKKSSTVRMRWYYEVYFATYSKIRRSYDRIQIKSGASSVSFDGVKTKTTYKKFKDGSIFSLNKGYFEFSKKSTPNIKKLTKTIKLLKKKSVVIKLSNSTNDEYITSTGKKMNVFNEFIKIYINILKRYGIK